MKIFSTIQAYLRELQIRHVFHVIDRNHAWSVIAQFVDDERDYDWLKNQP